jgi:hypothetical protein
MPNSKDLPYMVNPEGAFKRQEMNQDPVDCSEVSSRTRLPSQNFGRKILHALSSSRGLPRQTLPHDKGNETFQVKSKMPFKSPRFFLFLEITINNQTIYGKISKDHR